MQGKHAVRNLPETEQPMEKLERYGVGNLSDAELLALIIRTGIPGCNVIDTSRAILKACDGLLGLTHLTQAQLMQIQGIGRVKAAQLCAIVELSERISSYTHEENVILTDSESVAAWYMESMRHLETEELHAALFNTRGRLIKDVLISKGTVNETIVAPREIFIELLRYGAVYFILIHNHPGGDPEPGTDDYETTNRLLECGKMMGLPLMDHIIIGDRRYFSMREQGIIES